MADDQTRAVDADERKGQRSEVTTASGLPPPPLLSMYVRVWAAAVCCRVLSPPGRELRYNHVVAAAAALAFCLPLQPAALLVGFGIRILALLASFPYVHDSQQWSLHSDLAVVAALLAALARRRRRPGVAVTAGLSREEAVSIAEAAAATVRWQFVVFYAAAAFFKFNSGFMHHRFSCAPIYVLQLVERQLGADALRRLPAAVEALTAAAPTLILFVETLIPILLVLEIRSGLVFAAVFHWMIAVTPPPNNIGTFGMSTLPRFLLMVPDHGAAAAAVASLARPGATSLIVLAVAAVTTALQPMTYLISPDATDFLCGALVALVVIASVRSSPPPRSGTRPGAIGWALRAYAVFYGFVGIPLGLIDMGSANMFSSLRMHGGSNHYIVPTGLLQIAFADAPVDATLAGELFGGGVVRVESSNSSFLSGEAGVQYPGEIRGHAPDVAPLLRMGGHSGRQWSPMSYHCAIGNHRRPSAARNVGNNNDGFTYDWTDLVGDGRGAGGAHDNAPGVSAADGHYTVPAPEFRRLLREARLRYGDETFTVAGAVLPGPIGDETWRATAAAARFEIRHSPSEGARCVDGNTGATCARDVEAALLAPPSGHPLGWFVRRLLLSQPYPIVPEDIELGHGPSKRLHCFGP